MTRPYVNRISIFDVQRVHVIRDFETGCLQIRCINYDGLESGPSIMVFHEDLDSVPPLDIEDRRYEKATAEAAE
jgi:hypothetical protein